ncbi:MAG TPA: quercetin 2,3-dioxygenase [Solirubrobacteraceae bacterium]|nr:quercetin 2,3-dioxygenase [Solirubrobacteraceae bacterium]
MTTAAPPKPYRIPAGHGLADVWWKTGRMTVKAGVNETCGNFAQLETADPRGTATPMHIHHNEDEAFYVLDGEVTVLVGGERIDLGPGDYAYAPRGIVHAYVVRSERARMLVTITPGGLEQLFVECGLPVAEHEQPAEEVLPPIPELIRLFGAHGCDIVGPPPTLADL